MSERTFEQIRVLKRENKKLKQKIEGYEEKEKRLLSYIDELILEDKEKKVKTRVNKILTEKTLKSEYMKIITLITDGIMDGIGDKNDIFGA